MSETNTPKSADRRDRITVDLRGAGSRVHEQAAAQGMTVAAFVRCAVLAASDESEVQEGPDALDDSSSRLRIVKMTLRLPVGHAFLLARRARACELSQGMYVARLVDGSPPPAASPDRREALRELMRSTDQLAAIGTDLTAFMRLVRTGKGDQLEAYSARLMSLCDDVRRHLNVLSEFLAGLAQDSARSGGRSANGRR